MKLYNTLIFTVFLLLSKAAYSSSSTEAEAIFAGGCFWCMEPPFDKLGGVKSTTSGYIGGSAASANYKAVSTGGTGHYEAVKVVYDPTKVSYQQLLDVFWKNIDPFDARGQFCDKGDSYLSGIFFLNDEQKRLAVASQKKVMTLFEQKVVTEVLPASPFYDAEKYHQDYYQRNPIRYRFYRHGCGRDKRLEEIWGEPDS